MRPNTRPDDDSSSSPRVIAATGARPANMTAQEYDTATQRYHRGIGVRLPGAHADNWDWQLRARCRDLPVDHFYPRFGLRGHERRKVEANAKAICHGCPVRIDCRTPCAQSPRTVRRLGWAHRTRASRRHARRESIARTTHAGRSFAQPEAAPRRYGDQEVEVTVRSR